MAETLQTQVENFVNETVNKVQNNFGTTIEDLRDSTRKAMLANVGLFGLAFDNVKSLRENFKVESLFNEAVERGESIEGVAKERAEQARAEVNERFDAIESYIKQTLGRVEDAVSEDVSVIEVASDAVDAAKETATAAAEKVAEVVAMPFEGYGELNVKSVIAKLEDMTIEQLEAIKAYEVANSNRVTVVRAIDSMLAKLND